MTERLFGPQGIEKQSFSWDQRVESEIDFLLDLHRDQAFWGNVVQAKIRDRLQRLVADVQAISREEKDDR